MGLTDRRTAENADGLVVPGVGAFAAVVNGLRAVGGDQIIDRRLAGGRAVLGICVGLQVMFEKSTEHGQHDVAGLGQWTGTVERLPAEVVPHMGWNTLSPPEDTILFSGVESERFYFVHSFGVQRWTSSNAQEHTRMTRLWAIMVCRSSRRWRTARWRRLSSIRRSRGMPGLTCSRTGSGGFEL
jgi:glutamine amidotransferase